MDFVLLLLHLLEEIANVLMDDGHLFFAQIENRHVEANLAFGVLPEVDPESGILWLGPRIHGALLQGKRPIGNHQIQVVVDGVPEPLAAFASAKWAVEAKQAGLGLGERFPAQFAGELFVEPKRLSASRGFKERFS